MEQGESQIESASQFKQNPTGIARRWETEIAGAKKNQKDWQARGREAVQRYLDERPTGQGARRQSRLNLFHSDVNTFRSMLLGRLPQVDVDRRHQDQQDDEARVGAEILERLLNTDIDEGQDGYVASLKYAIEDWTLPGLGICRVRYEMEDEEQEVEAQTRTRQNPETGEDEEYEAAPAYTKTVRVRDDVETMHVYWQDFLWSPARKWEEVTWVAFGAPMREREFSKRFGKSLWKLAPKRQALGIVEGKEENDRDDLKRTWTEAYVWEIWDKDAREVVHYVEGMDRILSKEPDPYQLAGFFPCPRPLVANATTTRFIPKPDYDIARDLYDEIDILTDRISSLQRAAKVAGVYDASQEELPRLLEEAVENELVPCESMIQLVEKGGLAGVVQWMPLGDIVAAIEKLTMMRSEKIAMLHQVTGLSDILRGQAEQRATATEQRIKAGAASTRVQTAQDEVARFASDLQALKAELIGRWYAPETIIAKSNVMRTGDARFAEKAVALIKNQDESPYRIQVRPESISLPDLAAQKQQGIELMQAFSGFVPVLIQVGTAMPQALPFLLEVWQWIMAKFPGSAGVENVFDRMVAGAQQQAQQAAMAPKPPDPKLEAEKIRAEAEAKGAQAKLQQTQVDAQAHIATTQMDMAQKREEFGQKMAELKAKQEMTAQVAAFGGRAPVPGVTGGQPA